MLVTAYRMHYLPCEITHLCAVCASCPIRARRYGPIGDAVSGSFAGHCANSACKAGA